MQKHRTLFWIVQRWFTIAYKQQFVPFACDKDNYAADLSASEMPLSHSLR